MGTKAECIAKKTPLPQLPGRPHRPDDPHSEGGPVACTRMLKISRRRTSYPRTHPGAHALGRPPLKGGDRGRGGEKSSRSTSAVRACKRKRAGMAISIRFWWLGTDRSLTEKVLNFCFRVRQHAGSRTLGPEFRPLSPDRSLTEKVLNFCFRARIARYKLQGTPMDRTFSGRRR